jgi:hypothetical protein
MIGENVTTMNLKNMIVYTVKMLNGQGQVNMNVLNANVNIKIKVVTN